MAKKIDKMSIDKLAGVYSVASELFNEYTRMCDWRQAFAKPYARS